MNIKKEDVVSWFIMVAGMVIMGTQVYEYITGQIDGSAVEIGVFVIGFLLVRYPSALQDMVTAVGKKFTGKNE